MSIPAGPVPIPETVQRLAGGRELSPVWRNGLGGLTFRAVSGGNEADLFIKYGPLNDETTAQGEAERLSWARAFTPVPEVIEFGSEAEHEWLVTRALPGRSAVDPLWLARPERTVRAIGEGLRALHENLPVAGCPFDWGVSARLKRVTPRAAASLPPTPEPDRLVVCHGDACAPNTLLKPDGAWQGHVDLGGLGVADRWADLAVASMSLEWNFGPGWEPAFLDAYGIEHSEEHLTFYRALWNAE